MTDQITVPRATWDAMRGALEEIICAHPVTSTMRQVYAIVAGRNALTAANAVSDHFRGVTEMVQPLGWYCVSRDGLATQCADQRDAELTAKSANRDWPNSAPYRAVQLCEFEAHPQATEPAWRPIDTAPKDGSEILLFGDGRVTSGNWSAPSEIPRLIYRDGFAPEEEWDEWEPYWASSDGGFTEEHPPTHWMPLPAAPEAKQ